MSKTPNDNHAMCHPPQDLKRGNEFMIGDRRTGNCALAVQTLKMWVRRGFELGDLHREGKSDGAADPVSFSSWLGRVGTSKKIRK